MLVDSGDGAQTRFLGNVIIVEMSLGGSVTLFKMKRIRLVDEFGLFGTGKGW